MKKLKLLTLAFFLTPYSLLAQSTPEIINIGQRSDSVSLYDKFEIPLSIKAEFINPFDPEEIDITATFTSPSGKQWHIPGFYDYSSYVSLWKVRFSPNEVGEWRYIINVQDKNGQTSSEPKSFTTVASTFKGPIRVAANKRYLEYDNGSPFYGVGFWYNDGYAGFNSGKVTPEELDHLKELGVNFISTFITPLETLGSGLGRYDQNICGRLDELLEMCEERDMLLSLNLWFHSYLSETVWGGGNIRWHTNPYQQITPAKDFFRSELAWDFQEKLYRYFIARWGYSRSLALWFIVDEVNGTDGWISGDSLMAAHWGKQVHEYFQQHDPYRHPTTGTRSGGIHQFWHEGYQIFDIAAREIYEAQGFPIIHTGTLDSADTHPLTYSYQNYAQEIQKLWHGYEKPAIIAETGWDHTFYEPNMPGYLALYHNALWVSLTTGAAMTPFWWAYSSRLNDNLVTSQITSIRKFTDQIPFSTLTNLSPVEVYIPQGDGYAMSSDQLTFGWAVNANTDVVGDTITISSLKDGDYKLKLYHTWRGQFLGEEEIVSADQPAAEEIIKSNEGSVTFSVPVLFTQGSHANYIGQDIAFILEPLKKQLEKTKVQSSGR